MKVGLEPASRQGAHYGTAIPHQFRYRRIMKMIPMATLAITVGLFLGMQALLTELVQNQVDMHRQMAMMHDPT